jgi:hypothetical protein
MFFSLQHLVVIAAELLNELYAKQSVIKGYFVWHCDLQQFNSRQWI